MEWSPVTRRRVLAALGISATGGCMGRFSAGSESGIRLGSLRIANTTDDPRTVDIRIERSGETVYHDTSDVPGTEEVWIEPTWSSEPATYDLYYVLSGTNELQVGRITDLHEEDTEGECVFADLWIVDGADDSILTVTDVAEQEEATCNF